MTPLVVRAPVGYRRQHGTKTTKHAADGMEGASLLTRQNRSRSSDPMAQCQLGCAKSELSGLFIGKLGSRGRYRSSDDDKGTGLSVCRSDLQCLRIHDAHERHKDAVASGREGTLVQWRIQTTLFAYLRKISAIPIPEALMSLDSRGES